MKNSNLRPYQERAIQQISSGWSNHKRQILALTTGSGKTYTFVTMAKMAVDRGQF